MQDRDVFLRNLSDANSSGRALSDAVLHITHGSGALLD